MRAAAKQLLLASYYAASQPIRFAIRRRLRNTQQLPSAVLFYHRVADKHHTPWTISNKDFRKHIHYLKNHFELVPLSTLQSQNGQAASRKMMVSITFDDGYAENFDHAIPLLLAEGIPFTYFVSSNFILSQKVFPHDAKLGLNLRPNTPEQIRFLADRGVVIGGHTSNHSDMGTITAPEQVRSEILGDIRVLEALTGKPIEYFAFPYGDVNNMSQTAMDVLRSTNLRGMCSAYGEFNRPNTDLWHIRRIHGDPGMIRLKNWLTLDPRKLRRKKQFPFTFGPLGTSQPNPNQMLEAIPDTVVIPPILSGVSLNVPTTV
ncbi:MAG: polysaccharide deacetylase family protein [Planctomycetaceae bacterium]|nr:polysaccharide deacetylase family protein [Planctomycetaceae bacterium]